MNENQFRNISRKIPPVSPYGLIQETFWPNGWKILVACILLNCTTRRSAEKVIPKLFEVYPDPESMSDANKEDLMKIIAPLGFVNRRSNTLIKMSKKFLDSDWNKASELPGIGKYGNAAWEIFIEGNLPPEPPEDGALKAYYNWRMKHVSQK